MSDDEGDDGGLLGDPEQYEPSLGPSPPEVEIPEVPDPRPEPPDAADVDPETRQTFWRLVIVIDVALLALAVGPMFVFFENDWDAGLPLVALGVVSLGYALVQYRRFRNDGAA